MLLIRYPSVKQTLENVFVRYQSPKYLNSLDNDICNTISPSSFKISPKKYIINSYISQEELNREKIYYKEIPAIQ